MRFLSLKLAALVAVVLFSAFKGDKPAYLIYNSKSKAVAYNDLLEAAKQADVVFFGELHNNPISHWLQLQLTKDLHKARKDKLVLGAEMFEADNQLILNEYLNGNIKEKNFRQECRVWPNYKTDYAPLVDFAQENGLAFIATNIPRRYANVVFRTGPEGLEALSDEAKSYIAPLPIEIDLSVKCYADMLEMGMDHGGENLPKAQAVKDATMAHFIAQNRAEGQLFLHYNGAYHSDNREGILHYLTKLQPEAKILTITTVLEEDIEKLSKDSKDKADFTIAVPEDMTSTH